MGSCPQRLFSASTEDKKMTHTKQIVSRITIKNTENTGKKEEDTCDLLAVCESLSKLCETLSRLDYVIKRKNIELSLTRKEQGGIT